MIIINGVVDRKSEQCCLFGACRQTNGRGFKAGAVCMSANGRWLLMAASSSSSPSLDYYLVLDFEATCDHGKPPHPQEIIEFPVLKVNSRTLATEAVFHTYVQPTAHPVLSQFCTELTGITQAMVTGKPDLTTVLADFHQWMNTNGLLDDGVSFAFVTCGDWDLKTMLPSQCKYFHINIPSYFRSWINIKRVFTKLTGQKAVGMPSMLSHFKLTLDGRHHSGIDDTKNIAKILCRLAEINANIEPTTVLPN